MRGITKDGVKVLQRIAASGSLWQPNRTPVKNLCLMLVSCRTTRQSINDAGVVARRPRLFNRAHANLGFLASEHESLGWFLAEGQWAPLAQPPHHQNRTVFTDSATYGSSPWVFELVSMRVSDSFLRRGHGQPLALVFS